MKDWATKRLDEVMTIERGGSPRPIEDYLTDDPNGLNWIKISDATLSGKVIYETKEKIRPEGLKKSRMVHEGDFLLSNSMSFGRPYIMGTSGCIHDGWLVLKNKADLLDKDYLYYALSSPVIFDQFDRLAAGSTVRNLNTKLVGSVLIPIPPKGEQQRIVGKLDAAFAALSAAEGLVERNRANARELFESYLNGVFERKGDGWVEKRLGDIMIIERGGSPRPIQDFITNDPNGLNWIKIGDATASDKYIYETKEKIRPEGLKKSRFVEVDDFILSNSMSFGRPYIMKTTGCIHDGWLVLKEKERLLDQDFLYLALSSRYVFNQFDRLAAGSTVRNLNTQLVSRVTINFPTIAEQKKLVHAIDGVYKETKHLEATYQQKLSELAVLKKGLLGAAFRGEL